MFSSFLLFIQITQSVQLPTSLYEITTRPYLYLLQQRLNKEKCTIRDIPESDFDEWKEKGFEWVWFMGVWTLGNISRNIALTDPGCLSSYEENLPDWTPEDVIGSPYSIVNYTINPDVGTLEDIKWVREQLKKRGMKLMLDFVPNHSAWEAEELATHPNYYIYSKTRRDDDRFNKDGVAYGKEFESSAWTDVAQFNYFDQSFREHQVEVLKFIGSVADGVRCDMAHCVINQVFEHCWHDELIELNYTMPSVEFWTMATQACKAVYPEMKFLAESYHDNEQTLMDCGFDYAYDKLPYDSLTYDNPSEFRRLIRIRTPEYKSHGAYFTENHDEKRAVANFGYSYKKANAAAGCLLTLPGMRFFNQQQWFGPENKIVVQLRRAKSEHVNQDCVSFYDRLFEVLKLPSMKYGEFQQLDVVGSVNVIAYTYAYKDEHVLIAVNYSPNRSGCSIRLEDAPEGTVSFVEMIQQKTIQVDSTEVRNQGLYVVFEPYQVQVFKY